MSSQRLDWKDSNLSQPDNVQVLVSRNKYLSWSAGSCSTALFWRGTQGSALSQLGLGDTCVTLPGAELLYPNWAE